MIGLGSWRPYPENCIHADYRNSGNSSRRASLSRRQLKMLEMRAGIDALACLTIFVRSSLIRGSKPKFLTLELLYIASC